MESLWIVLRGGCLHFEGGGGFGGRTCWTQARRHHLGGERHTLPSGDPRGGPQSEFLLSFSEPETFPRLRNHVSRAMRCCDCIPILFSSFLFSFSLKIFTMRLDRRDLFLFQFYIFSLIFTFLVELLLESVDILMFDHWEILLIIIFKNKYRTVVSIIKLFHNFWKSSN